jgi:hypothetical protein
MQRPHPPNSRPPPAYGVVRNSNPSRIYIQSIPLALRCENDSLQITTHCKAWHCMNKLQHATPPCVGTIAESSKSMFHYRMMWLCCAGVAWPRPPRAGNDDASTGCSWRATSAGRCTHGRAHAGSHAHVLCAAWSHGAPWHAASRVHAHGMGAGGGGAPPHPPRPSGQTQPPGAVQQQHQHAHAGAGHAQPQRLYVRSWCTRSIMACGTQSAFAAPLCICGASSTSEDMNTQV